VTCGRHVSQLEVGNTDTLAVRGEGAVSVASTSIRLQSHVPSRSVPVSGVAEWRCDVQSSGVHEAK
jgi:hypothetical protein